MKTSIKRKEVLRVEGCVTHFKALEIQELGLIKLGDDFFIKDKNHHLEKYFGIVDRISEYELVTGEKEVKIRLSFETDEGSIYLLDFLPHELTA